MSVLRRGSLLFPAAVIGLALSASTAHAEPPPEQTGFQLALRLGPSLPFGTVSASTPMSDALGAQVPLSVDFGSKLSPSIFLGAFVSGAFGGTAGALTKTCTNYGVSCDGLWFRGGFLVEYNIHPERTTNPWIGYGIGYEIGGSTGSYGRNTITNAVRGLDFAHLLGGIDFRLQDYFGIGPFVDGAFGLYNVARTTVNSGGYILSSPPADTSLHLWLTVGIRVVMRP